MKKSVWLGKHKLVKLGCARKNETANKHGLSSKPQEARGLGSLGVGEDTYVPEGAKFLKGELLQMYGQKWHTKMPLEQSEGKSGLLTRQ